jgi:hypothetical protein
MKRKSNKTKAEMQKKYTTLKTSAITTADNAVKRMLEYRLKYKIFIVTTG